MNLAVANAFPIMEYFPGADALFQTILLHTGKNGYQDVSPAHQPHKFYR